MIEKIEGISLLLLYDSCCSSGEVLGSFNFPLQFSSRCFLLGSLTWSLQITHKKLAKNPRHNEDLS